MFKLVIDAVPVVGFGLLYLMFATQMIRDRGRLGTDSVLLLLLGLVFLGVVGLAILGAMSE